MLLAVTWAVAFTALGAFAAGLGSLLGGYAALQSARTKAHDQGVQEGRQQVLADLSDWGGGGEH